MINALNGLNLIDTLKCCFIICPVIGCMSNGKSSWKLIRWMAEFCLYLKDYLNGNVLIIYIDNVMPEILIIFLSSYSIIHVL